LVVYQIDYSEGEAQGGYCLIHLFYGMMGDLSHHLRLGNLLDIAKIYYAFLWHPVVNPKKGLDGCIMNLGGIRRNRDVIYIVDYSRSRQDQYAVA
jgi:hypothetical protein